MGFHVIHKRQPSPGKLLEKGSGGKKKYFLFQPQILRVRVTCARRISSGWQAASKKNRKRKIIIIRGRRLGPATN